MNPQQLRSRLFFIVGCGRSGTTLLKSMLDAHPGVFVPAETFFFSGIRRRFPGGDAAPWEAKLDYICSRWWMRDAGLTQSAVRAQLEPGTEPDWAALFLATMAALAPGDAYEAVGEKTPAHVADAEELLEFFPACKIVQIVRDPRAVLASYRGVKVGTNEAVAVAREWKIAVRAHHALADHDRYLMIRYEDLVTRPDQALALVCQHLGLQFDPAMLDFHQRDRPGYAVEQAHHAATQRPIFQSSIDAWKEKLPARQWAILEHLLATEMPEMGYAKQLPESQVRASELRMCELRERIHRVTIRRARQLLKRRRAMKRLAQARGQAPEQAAKQGGAG